MSATMRARAAPAAKQKKSTPLLPPTEAPDPLLEVSPGARRTVITQLVSRRLPGPKPELQPFARKLNDAMRAKNLSASDLARAVWGTTKDYRGYSVARNRDRIGHYLAGLSYPEPDNLKKLAEALGLAIEELALPAEVRDPGSPGMRDGRAGMLDTQIILLNAYPGVCTVQLRRLMSIETAMNIMQLLQDDVLPESVRGLAPP